VPFSTHESELVHVTELQKANEVSCNILLQMKWVEKNLKREKKSMNGLDSIETK
jgi:hypothetical protein